LLGYAIWGVPLLLVRRWSTKALVIALLVCAASLPIYQVTRATYETVAGRADQWAAAAKAERERDRAVNTTYRAETQSTNYATVVAARIRHMPFFYSRWFSFLPTNNFALFLIGLLGLRLGVFEYPRQHRRLIIGIMIFGVASWAAAEWLFPLP